jgi:adenosylcobinamide kinase/adenosylcobinamide-phosphate guanylyltransferase
LKTTLILGGARSGKSTMAQELAAKAGSPVLFVATAEAGDRDMEDRIEAHRRSRSPEWQTLEVTTHVGGSIARNMGTAGTVVVDCITLLVNNIFEEHSGETDAGVLENAVTAEIQELIDNIKRVDAWFIIVSNEVGLGIVPADRVSRIYRDLLGKANRMLAEHADEVYLLVAGIPVTIKKA